MKHQVHVNRIALGRALVLWREKKPKATKKEAAAAVGVSPRRARRILQYLEAHQSEPIVEELGELSHAVVKQHGAAGIAELRAMLIRNHSAGIGLAKRTARLDDRDAKALANAVGLECFKHNGRVLIHWKHGGG